MQHKTLVVDKKITIEKFVPMTIFMFVCSANKLHFKIQ